MLRNVVDFAAKAVAQQKFDRILAKTLPTDRWPERIGLAISGGVDSMALASLCNSVRRVPEGSHKPMFHGFVVDHGVRSGSDIEAATVAQRLKDMGINCDVLGLEEGLNDSSKTSNFESVARKLRYRSLGAACCRLRIEHLFLAHHGDDQAETVLSRIHSGYTGFGLRGIPASSPIPECHGVWRVSNSGMFTTLPDTLFHKSEGRDGDAVYTWGGIRIHRPLLDFTKSELITTCQKRRVHWVEDATNVDKTLTLRNAVRHIFRHHNLPSALSPERLRTLFCSKEQHYQSCEVMAQHIFRDCRFRVDVGSSTLSFSLPPDVYSRLSSSDNPELLAALLLRRILSVSEPEANLPLQGLFLTVKLVFPDLFGSVKTEARHTNIGNISVMLQDPQPKGAVEELSAYEFEAPNMPVYIVRPKLPLGPEKHEQTLIVRRSYRSDDEAAITILPTLFFDRYWVQLRFVPRDLLPGVSFIVRFLREDDIVTIRGLGVRRKEFERFLRRHAPGKIRYTLPAIVERMEAPQKDGSIVTKETVCVLPSIGWHLPGWKSGMAGERSQSNPEVEVEKAWWYNCYYKDISHLRSGRYVAIRGIEGDDSRSYR